MLFETIFFAKCFIYNQKNNPGKVTTRTYHILQLLKLRVDLNNSRNKQYQKEY